jgi:poly-gamma-glutamate synthesis protein (capsule biosynthesis protein)
MVKRERILLASVLAGVTLLLTGCGDDMAAAVPLTGTVIESEEAADLTENISAEEKTESTSGEVMQQTLAEDQTEEIEEETQAQEIVPTPEEITITISAAGDCSLGNYLGQDYSISFDQTYEKVQDPGYFFANVKDIFEEDDMTIVNLEGVLSDAEIPAEGRTYNIKGSPEYVQILTAGNVEAVSMGNNHRQDYGAEGTEDTVAALEEAGIVYAYDWNLGIYEVKGIKIGYVSVNEVAWGQESERLIQKSIETLKEQEADLIIACCHWGIEKDNYTEEYQNKLGRICIDAGADLVLGHHPHVLQGIEEYNGRYIVYSLANFSFGANRNPADKDTMIFRQTFTFVDGIKQETKDAKVIPCSVSSVAERNNYQPTPLEGEAAARVIERLNTYSENLGVVIDLDGTLK